jgi:hypothetical protein
MSARRKTGQPPQVRQPLKIDRLSKSMRDRILRERNSECRTWEEIELDSPGWDEWKAAPEEIKQLFPGQRLPHTNLHRWYDLRYAQVERDVMVKAAQAREIAAAFAKATVEGSDEAIVNAARDLIFGMLPEGDAKGRQKAAGGLIALAEVVQAARANDIKERKVSIDERRITQLEKDAELKRRQMEKGTEDAAKKLSKGELTVEDINRLRERTFGLPPISQSA